MTVFFECMFLKICLPFQKSALHLTPCIWLAEGALAEPGDFPAEDCFCTRSRAGSGELRLSRPAQTPALTLALRSDSMRGEVDLDRLQARALHYAGSLEVQKAYLGATGTESCRQSVLECPSF